VTIMPIDSSATGGTARFVSSHIVIPEWEDASMFEIISEMSKSFNMSQLRDLQFDLSYEAYQDLDGIQSKSDMARETIAWFIEAV
jgi:hypothetical protein